MATFSRSASPSSDSENEPRLRTPSPVQLPDGSQGWLYDRLAPSSLLSCVFSSIFGIADADCDNFLLFGHRLAAAVLLGYTREIAECETARYRWPHRMSDEDVELWFLLNAETDATNAFNILREIGVFAALGIAEVFGFRVAVSHAFFEDRTAQNPQWRMFTPKRVKDASLDPICLWEDETDHHWMWASRKPVPASDPKVFDRAVRQLIAAIRKAEARAQRSSIERLRRIMQSHQEYFKKDGIVFQQVIDKAETGQRLESPSESPSESDSDTDDDESADEDEDEGADVDEDNFQIRSLYGTAEQERRLGLVRHHERPCKPFPARTQVPALCDADKGRCAENAHARLRSQAAQIATAAMISVGLSAEQIRQVDDVLSLLRIGAPGAPALTPVPMCPSADILAEEISCLKAHLMESLRGAPCSLVIDEMLADVAGSKKGVVVYACSPVLKQGRACLGIRLEDTLDVGTEYYATLLKSTMTEYNIVAGNVVGVISNNTAAIPVAARSIGLHHLPCIARTLDGILKTIVRAFGLRDLFLVRKCIRHVSSCAMTQELLGLDAESLLESHRFGYAVNLLSHLLDHWDDYQKLVADLVDTGALTDSGEPVSRWCAPLHDALESAVTRANAAVALRMAKPIAQMLVGSPSDTWSIAADFFDRVDKWTGELQLFRAATKLVVANVLAQAKISADEQLHQDIGNAVQCAVHQLSAGAPSSSELQTLRPLQVLDAYRAPLAWRTAVTCLPTTPAESILMLSEEFRDSHLLEFGGEYFLFTKELQNKSGSLPMQYAGDPMLFWVAMHADAANNCPTVTRAALLALSIPTSSTATDSGFNVLTGHELHSRLRDAATASDMEGFQTLMLPFNAAHVAALTKSRTRLLLEEHARLGGASAASASASDYRPGKRSREATGTL